MKTCLNLERRFSNPLPDRFKTDDNRLSESLLEFLIDELTQPGDCVFDPFAGFATTLFSAEKLGRVGYGVEADQDRVEYARTLISKPEHLVYCDVRNMDLNDFPRFALSVSSPIYMHRHEKIDPLSTDGKYGDYDAYLNELVGIYEGVAKHIKEDGHLVVEASNLKGNSGVTTFAWDLAREVSSVLTFDGEIIINWDHCGHGYDHSYCLLFKA